LVKSKVLRGIVALDSLLMAYGHAPLALFLRFLFMTGGPPTRPLSGGSPGGFGFFFALGAYFLFATVVYLLGAVFVAAGKLFKLSNAGLLVLALVDNVLLLYTRMVPGNIFFNHVIGWSWDWFPRLGTVQVLLGQTLLIVLCAILYRSK